MKTAAKIKEESKKQDVSRVKVPHIGPRPRAVDPDNKKKGGNDSKQKQVKEERRRVDRKK